MASAFLIERTGKAGPRSIILARWYPCSHIAKSEQTLLKVCSGSTFAVARRAVLVDLGKEDSGKAERLDTAIRNADEKARASGKKLADFVEVGLFGLGKE